MLTLRSCVAIAQLTLVTSVSQAQVVRGIVRESATATPIEGALVTLERLAADASVTASVSALSNARGEFAIRAPGAGRYRLAAKRIGVKRTITDPFELGPEETRQETLLLEPLLYSLPEVAVASPDFCISKREQSGQVAVLWEDMRTALTATSISVRDSLYRGRIVTFGRVLDGRGRVITENTHHYDGLLNETFAGIAPESLSLNGYWRHESDSVRFFALDVDALLAPSFLRDHCFELAAETNDEIGLNFQPVQTRLADVRGTIWADARTFELRRINFTYTHLPRMERPERFGGEIHFARLASGAWVVRRWSIRVPQFAATSSRTWAYRRSYERVNPSSVRIDIVKTVPNRMIEHGGVAYVDHLRTFENPAIVRGVVLDSLGAPLRRATVRLGGTAYASPIDSAGRFLLDSVPPGLYRLEAVVDSTSAPDVAIAESEVVVEPGAEKVVNLKGSGVDELLARFCGGRSISKDRTAIKVLVIDSAANRPEADVALRMWWTEYVRERGANRVVNQQLDATTAMNGSAIFCGLPMNVSLDIGVALGPDRARRLDTFSLTSRLPATRMLRQH